MSLAVSALYVNKRMAYDRTLHAHTERRNGMRTRLTKHGVCDIIFYGTVFHWVEQTMRFSDGAIGMSIRTSGFEVCGNPIRVFGFSRERAFSDRCGPEYESRMD